LKLVNQQPSDADYRTAANRAYYACHLLGCERGIIERTNSARDHSKLWEELRRRGMFWANKLEVLYRIREHADYHINSEDRDNVGCSYCKISAESMWGNAKAITEDILPRIKSMKKKDIKTPK
jgi:hypothetical protein